MKGLFKIFELSKYEQRVVLIVILILIVFAFLGYERRVHHVHARTPTVSELKASSTPEQTEEQR